MAVVGSKLMTCRARSSIASLPSVAGLVIHQRSTHGNSVKPIKNQRRGAMNASREAGLVSRRRDKPLLIQPSLV